MELKFFLRTLVLAAALCFLPGGTSAFSETPDEWTGFFYPNGDTRSVQTSGPFKTLKDCVVWGKSKVWRGSDDFRCGSGCTQNIYKDWVCRNFEQDILSEEKPLASPGPAQPERRVLTS